MYLKSLELSGFKSFAKKSELSFNTPITSIVGPNGSGKSNVAEAFRFVLGEQSIKSMRGKKGEDLIWNGSAKVPRQNRASVKLVFDNSRKLLNVDFDEVTFERVVHRDGVNEYLVNGTAVRLRDIMELLAGAHIGASGHHIISQGEADRILNANNKERRLMIEDALGLKIYHYKKQESQRKLAKTEENIASVESLRKEIAPHLRFLKKQVEKIEKAAELRKDLTALYHEYFRREHAYLAQERTTIENERRIPAEDAKKIEQEIAAARRVLESSKKADDRSRELLAIESDLRAARGKKDTLIRDVGRLEGEISAEERRLRTLEIAAKTEETRTIALGEVKNMAAEISAKVTEAEAVNDIGALRAVLSRIKEIVAGFVEKYRREQNDAALNEGREEIAKLRDEKERTEKSVAAVSDEERAILSKYESLRQSIEKEKDTGREAEKDVFRLMARQNEVNGKLSVLMNREETLRLEEAEYKREMGEAAAVAGTEALRYVAVTAEEAAAFGAEARAMQLERRRALEKLKIRIEEMGAGGSAEVMKEYQEVEQRDAFLAREVADLQSSAESLKKLIAELEERLGVEFRDGVVKINSQFQNYFALMFGGGSASVEVIKEVKKKPAEESDLLEEVAAMGEAPEEESEEGIDIKVNLPHKRVKGLEMLSGGERALTSIALLFAVSLVNPPPFIILDETDAALDEANSRKYGDIIENLSKHSQLILITHNRETMSRAGVLYGVTMGSDGVSKLLSIAFEEAVAVAK